MEDPSNATPADRRANELQMAFINAQRAYNSDPATAKAAAKALLKHEFNSLDSDVRKRLNALEGSPRFVKDDVELSKFIRDHLDFFYVEKNANGITVLRKRPELHIATQGGARKTKRKMRKGRKSRRTRHH